MYKIIVLIVFHLFGDLVFTSPKVRKLKIEKFSYLLKHVGIYTLIFLIFSPIILQLTIVQGLIYSITIGLLHLIIDYISILLKKKFWKEQKFNFAIVINVIEHIIHIIILIGAYVILFPENNEVLDILKVAYSFLFENKTL